MAVDGAIAPPLNLVFDEKKKLMRYKGKLTNWQDEKGFGFITPAIGEKQVFVHIYAKFNLKNGVCQCCCLI